MGLSAALPTSTAPDPSMPSSISHTDTIGNSLAKRVKTRQNPANEASVTPISIAVGVYTPHSYGNCGLARDGITIRYRFTHIPTLTSIEATSRTGIVRVHDVARSTTGNTWPRKKKGQT